MKTTIFFDFDGTLADTFGVVAGMMSDFSKGRLSSADFDEMREVGIRATLKRHRVPLLLTPLLVYKMRKALRAKSIKLFPDIPQVIKALAQTYQLGILSSNSEVNVARTLEAHDLREHFAFIHSGSSLFGKARILNNVCNKRGIEPAHVIYVGDEDRDIIAAREAGMQRVAVTWGYNTRRRLEEVHPDMLVDTPLALVDVIKRVAE